MRIVATAALAAILVPAAVGSVPTTRVTIGSSELTSRFDVRDSRNVSRDLNRSLDLHPFSNEFYLLEFASETVPSDSSRQHSSWFSTVLNPVTNAASGLSKKVASLRRALARKMP